MQPQAEKFWIANHQTSIGETKWHLNSRENGNKLEVNNIMLSLVGRHFDIKVILRYRVISKEASAPLISYTHTSPIAAKLFNYKITLHDIDINQFRCIPPNYGCCSSVFNYKYSGYVNLNCE